jgi:glycosyltransferase involved in cell wall biosynthesis
LRNINEYQSRCENQLFDLRDKGFLCGTDFWGDLTALIFGDQLFESVDYVGILQYRRVLGVLNPHDVNTPLTFEMKSRKEIVELQARFYSLSPTSIQVSRAELLDQSLFEQFIISHRDSKELLIGAAHALNRSMELEPNTVLEMLKSERHFHPHNIFLAPIDFFQQWRIDIFESLHFMDRAAHTGALKLDRQASYVVERLFSVYLQLHRNNHSWLQQAHNVITFKHQLDQDPAQGAVNSKYLLQAITNIAPLVQSTQELIVMKDQQLDQIQRELNTYKKNRISNYSVKFQKFLVRLKESVRSKLVANLNACLPNVSKYQVFTFLRRLKTVRSFRDLILLMQLVFKRFAVQSRAISGKNKLHPNLEYKIEKNFAPLVSIIVPNYNHSAFLEKRLATIVNQTYKNFEIIILDDASTDNSITKIEKFIKVHNGRIKLIKNSINSGSGYNQWKRGIEESTGEIIWIAESDDLSSLDFLELMIPHFANRAVRLAFSNTQFFRRDASKSIWSLREYWSSTCDFSSTEEFTISLEEFLEGGMAKKNLIPNVSSCLFRKPPAYVLDNLVSFKYVGDWYFYIETIGQGLVCFEPKVTNYYRIHPNSTIQLNNKSKSFENELVRVHDLIGLYSTKVTILIAIPGFTLGGGEIFALRLARTLYKRGKRVAILDCNFIEANLPVDHEQNYPPIYQPVNIINFMGSTHFKFDIIHTHHASVDFTISKYKPEKTRHLISLHGMYEEMEELNQIRHEELFLQNKPTLTYLHEKNLSGFQSTTVDLLDFIKVQNFLDDEADSGDRATAIGDAQFVLASRAIEGKGWLDAILGVKTAREISNKDIHLHLLGDGPLREELQKSYIFEWLHFDGLVKSPNQYSREMDGALFLSSYKGESFPLVLLEFMQVGLPVIYTDIAATCEIMTLENKLLIEPVSLINGERDRIEVAEKILSILTMPEEERMDLKENLKRRANQFAADQVLPNYLSLYENE